MHYSSSRSGTRFSDNEVSDLCSSIWWPVFLQFPRCYYILLGPHDCILQMQQNSSKMIQRIEKKICALRVVLLTAEGWMSNASPCPHNTPRDQFSFIHFTNEFTWLTHANMQIPKPESFLRICSRKDTDRVWEAGYQIQLLRCPDLSPSLWTNQPFSESVVLKESAVCWSGMRILSFDATID